MNRQIGTGPRVARIVAVLVVVGAWSWALVAPASAGAAPDVTIAKVSDATGPLHVGDAFSYTLTVSNTGTATAHAVEVQDNLPLGIRVRTLVPTFAGGQCTVVSSTGTGHPERWSLTCTRASLAAGASADITFDVSLLADVHCGALTNTASVSASDEPAIALGNDEASVTDTVTCPPSIAITKAAPSFAHVGSSVRLTMHVTNTGHVALGHVTVADPGCDAAPHGDGDGTLSPGERWTYECAHVVRAGAPDWFATTATVHAVSTSGAAHASAHAATRVLKSTLAVSVTPTPVSGSPGDTITYRYVVRNTGNATLSDVTVTDDQLGSIGTAPQLAPGHSVRFSAQRTVSATHLWVTNTATAAAHDPSGHRVTGSARASVTIVGATATGGSNNGGDGTAFTGGDATRPASVALVLAIVGTVSLVVAARRRG